jgi:hypothetical protein
MSLSTFELHSLIRASSESEIAQEKAAKGHAKIVEVYNEPRVKALKKLSSYVLETLDKISEKNSSSDYFEVLGPRFAQQALDKCQVNSKYPSELQLTEKDVKFVINSTLRIVQHSASQKLRENFDHQQLKKMQALFLKDKCNVDISPESMDVTKKGTFKIKSLLKSFKDIAIQFQDNGFKETIEEFNKAKEMLRELKEITPQLHGSVRNLSDIKTKLQSPDSFESFKEGLQSSSSVLGNRLHDAGTRSANCVQLSIYEYLAYENKYYNCENNIGLTLNLDTSTNMLAVGAYEHGQERDYQDTTRLYSFEIPANSQEAKDIFEALISKSDMEGILKIKTLIDMSNQAELNYSENPNNLTSPAP